MITAIVYRYVLIIIVFVFSYVGFSLCGLIPDKIKIANRAVAGRFVSGFLSEPDKTMTARLIESGRKKEFQETDYYFELPQAIIIDKLNVNISVENPDESNQQTLKQALSHGVVRHPFSGKLGENRPLFIFGHSARTPFAHNRAYKALNGLEKLDRGDIILIRSKTREYVFEVENVEHVRAGQKRISFQDKESLLIISTCDVFGSSDDRIVVTARFADLKRRL